MNVVIMPNETILVQFNRDANFVTNLALLPKGFFIKPCGVSEHTFSEETCIRIEKAITLDRQQKQLERFKYYEEYFGVKPHGNA